MTALSVLLGLAGRRARAAPAAADHRGGAARLAGHARRAHRAGGPARRAQGAGRHLRRDARAPVRRLRQPAALRGQRVARAAHAADRHAHRARGDARRPARPPTRSCARWPKRSTTRWTAPSASSSRCSRSRARRARSRAATPSTLRAPRGRPWSTPRAKRTRRGSRSPPTCTPRRWPATGACSSAWWRTSSRTPSATTAPVGACRSPPRTRDGRSVVEVVNDGDVLDAAVLPTLLEPFQRIDRGARGDGAGLGLSIVRSVAQAHGGAVALAVCPEGGLRATVTLPRREPADPTHPDRYSRERAHA